MYLTELGSAPVGLPERLLGAAGPSLQVEEILQEGLDVFVGFVRRRLLVEATRKAFFHNKDRSAKTAASFRCLEPRHSLLPQGGIAGR